VGVDSIEVGTQEGRAGYRRSARSARGEARRHELLERVTEDLARNGLVGFSLRRAARAAGTTHKVLLYHFESVDDLLVQGVQRLRQQRVSGSLAAAMQERTLAERVRAVWPVLVADEAIVLDQAIGLAMYDSARYAVLGQGASEQYIPALASLCPESWSDDRRLQVAALILGTLRGFLIDARTSNDPVRLAAGFDALARALDREEEADREHQDGR
jgi:AcrR family transcriptional regulator